MLNIGRVGLLAALLCVGCYSNERIRYGEPGGREDGRNRDERPREAYEIVWVDPSIVYADSIITVIHAGRIDSVLLKPGEQGAAPAADVSFQVTAANCPVTVSLAESSGRTIRPLFLQNLRNGHYRASLNMAAGSLGLVGGRQYRLVATYCNGERSEAFRAGE